MNTGAEQLGDPGTITPARLRVLATAGTGVYLELSSKQARALAAVLEAHDAEQASIERVMRAANAAKAASDRARARYERNMVVMGRTNWCVWLVVMALCVLSWVI